MLRTSVIVSTYNQPEFLELVLASLALQSAADFEVVVADDGSGSVTRELLERPGRELPYPLRHVWQEDAGFRKGMALNKAVKEASAPYLIFNDGDCIAHPEFVRAHLDLASRDAYLIGRTPRLSRKITERITLDAVRRGRAQRASPDKWWDDWCGDTRRMEFGVYVGNDWLFRRVQKTKKKLELWGGNFSCFKEHYVQINGFNEDMDGWGKEDDEIGVRFTNLGLRPVSAANRAVNFHLWHPKASGLSESIPRNLALKVKYRESGEYYCPSGYDNR